MESNGNACPKCGGTSGLEVTMREYKTMSMEWNGDMDGGDILRVTVSRTGVCLDCGKRVKAPQGGLHIQRFSQEANHAE